MSRTTKETLQTQVRWLNASLGRPTEMFASKVGEQTKFNDGHIALDKNMQGYALEEQIGVYGAAHRLTGRMTAGGMSTALKAMMTGISLRNHQLIKAGHAGVM